MSRRKSARWPILQSAKVDDRQTAKKALGYEIFDTIWNLCALANAADIDIESAAVDKDAG